jgi:hypothetical protein
MHEGFMIWNAHCDMMYISHLFLTGDGELPAYVELARQIEAAISVKAGTIALDDSEWDDGASDIKSEIEVKDVIKISTDDDEEPKSIKPKHTGPKRSVVKAFHVSTHHCYLRGTLFAHISL